MTYELHGVSHYRFQISKRIKTSVSASLVTHLARHWVGKLGHYGSHQNDEHCVRPFEEAIRYTGLHLENDLVNSKYWSAMPLHQRALVLLFLVDRGVVERAIRRGRRVFRAAASCRVLGREPAIAASLPERTLELIAALRHELVRRVHSLS